MSSLAWKKTFAITPKFSALISLLSSSALVYMITRNPLKKNKNKSYHRIMLGMSVCDICASAGWFMSTWLEPSDSGTYGAVGTKATCSLQGFLTQISLSTIFYNGTLAIYYLLILVKKWDRERFAKIEPFLHLHALAWGIVTSIAGVSFQLYYPAGFSCWVTYWAYKWIFLYGPLWIIIFLVTVCMSWVYWSVLQEEKQDMVHITDDQNESQPKKNSRRLANRAGLYVGAFYLTWIMPSILEIINFTPIPIPPFLVFLSALLIPLQGAPNLVIYTLPAFAKYRKRDHVKDQFLLLIWFKMLAHELGLLEEKNGNDNENEHIQQREGLEKGSLTMSQWMLNPTPYAEPDIQS